jgi:hypothetical protein
MRGMGAVRRNRALFACLTLAVVWMQTLGGVLCTAMGSRGVPGPPGDIVGIHIICSAETSGVASTGGAPGSTEQRCCDLCLAAATLAPPSPPPGMATPIALTLDAPRWNAAIVSLAETLRRAGLNSRAPPLRA